MRAELEFFKQFITDPQGAEHYIKEVQKDGIWADDLEIQIISEIYDCRIEIYTTSNQPVKTFNERPEAIRVPFRLFYVQQCHYDVIWDPKRPHPLQGHPFGMLERAAIEAAQDRDTNTKKAGSSANLKDVNTSSPSPSTESRNFFEKQSMLSSYIQ